MTASTDRVTEADIAFVVLQIAAAAPNGVADFDYLKKEIPNHITLSAADRAPSVTRNGEEMWEQQIRNIQSHHNADGNYIHEGYLTHVPGVGYQITDAGRALLKSKGY